MKKLIGLLGLLAFTNGFLTSCVPDESGETGDIVNNFKSVNTTKGTYLGTTDAKGKFAVTVETDEVNFELFFISNAVPAKDLLDGTLTSETYAVSSTGDLYTITTDSYLKKGDQTLKINDAKLIVTNRNDGKTNFKGSITDEENNVYEINYSGLLDIEPIYDTEYEIQNGWFWGDNQYDYPNIGEYMSFFTQGDANKYGELEDDGTGYHISLSFFDEMPAKAWEAEIPNKTFKASTKREVGTFLIQVPEKLGTDIDFTYAFFQHNNSTEGIKKKLYITDGTIKISEDEEGQQLRFNIELEDGSRHIGKYTGKVRQGDEYSISTLKSDLKVGNLHQGFLDYRGKSPIEGNENNRWDLYLLNEGLTTYPEYYWYTEGSGEFMRLTLYTEVSETTAIPVGTYPIGDEKAGNASTGGGLEIGLDFGTWYYQLKNDDYINYAPTRTGAITVAKEGDIYSIKVNAVDDKGNTVTGSYTGELTFVNSAKKPLAKQKSISKKHNRGKAFDATKALRNKK